MIRQLYALWIGLRHRRALNRLARIRIAGSPVRRTPITRSSTLGEQFERLKPEFAGKSELLFFAYCCAVKARRGDRPERHAEMIRYCLLAFGPSLYAEINTRWLVSLLNTLADHGRRGEDGAARALTAWLHCMKVYETVTYLERVRDPTYPSVMIAYTDERTPRWRDPNIYNDVELWDYMFAMELSGGDILRNAYARLRDERYPVVRDACDAALARIRESDTVMRRIMARNQHFPDVS